MAHFYGTVQGSKGKTTRCGTKKSGMVCTVSGWDTGVQVEVEFDTVKQKDIVKIYKTDGSNSCNKTLFITWEEDPWIS